MTSTTIQLIFERQEEMLTYATQLFLTTGPNLRFSFSGTFASVKESSISNPSLITHNPMVQAQRSVKTLQQGLKKLKKYLSSYRSTPSYNLGLKTPHELMAGRKIKTVLDLLNLRPDR